MRSTLTAGVLLGVCALGTRPRMRRGSQTRWYTQFCGRGRAADLRQVHPVAPQALTLLTFVARQDQDRGRPGGVLMSPRMASATPPNCRPRTSMPPTSVSSTLRRASSPRCGPSTGTSRRSRRPPTRSLEDARTCRGSCTANTHQPWPTPPRRHQARRAVHPSVADHRTC